MNMSRTAHVIVLWSCSRRPSPVCVLATGREISPMAPGNVTSGTEHSELAQCLSQLREEIELLRKDLDGREQASSTSESRRPIEVPAADLQALDRLGRRSMSCSPGACRGDTTSPIEAGSAPLLDADRARQSEEPAALRKQAPTERLPDHFLRTPRQIAERYGVPDSTFCSTRRRAELRVPAQRVRAPSSCSHSRAACWFA